MILAVGGRNVSKAGAILRDLGEAPFQIGSVIAHRRGPRVVYQ